MKTGAKKPGMTPTKILALCFIVGGSLGVLAIWVELYRRYRLYVSYGSVPYLNHVDEGYFEFVTLWARVGMVWMGIGAALAWGLRFRVLAGLCLLMATTGVAAPRLLDYYHRHLMLVTYGEFALNLGP
jgi:hypothetical protein